MNAKSKKTLKAAALAAGLVAVLLPTGCSPAPPPPAIPAAQAPGSASTVVAPHTAECYRHYPVLRAGLVIIEQQFLPARLHPFFLSISAQAGTPTARAQRVIDCGNHQRHYLVQQRHHHPETGTTPSTRRTTA